MKTKNKFFNVPANMFLSKDGDWFHEGIKITHKGIIDKLNRSISREGDDYFVTIGYERAKVTLEDAPYIITGVNEDGENLILEISDGARERFDPSSLQIGKDNVPYTIIKDTKDRARFSRPAYYQLAQFIIEDPDGNPALKIGNKNYPIKIETL